MKVGTKWVPSCILPWFIVPLDYLDSIGVFLRPVYNHYMFREFPYVNSRDYVVRAKSTPDWAMCTRTYTRTGTPWDEWR